MRLIQCYDHLDEAFVLQRVTAINNRIQNRCLYIQPKWHTHFIRKHAVKGSLQDPSLFRRPPCVLRLYNYPYKLHAPISINPHNKHILRLCYINNNCSTDVQVLLDTCDYKSMYGSRNDYTNMSSYHLENSAQNDPQNDLEPSKVKVPHVYDNSVLEAHMSFHFHL